MGNSRPFRRRIAKARVARTGLSWSAYRRQQRRLNRPVRLPRTRHVPTRQPEPIRAGFWARLWARIRGIFLR